MGKHFASPENDRHGEAPRPKAPRHAGAHAAGHRGHAHANHDHAGHDVTAEVPSAPLGQEPSAHDEPQVPARGPYAGPYVPPEAAGNPYVNAPTSGAVGMTAQQVGPHARGQRGASGKASSQCQGAPGTTRRRRRRVPVLAVVGVAVAAAAVAGAWLLINPPIYSVTVNGVSRTVNAGATVQTLIDEGYATPSAGDLMAIDGSVATPGGGNPFDATVNGQATNDPSTAVPRGATVEVSDGSATIESYTETTSEIEPDDSGTTSLDSTTAYWAGSIHIYSDGEPGEQVTRTGDVSGKTVTEVTKEPVSAGYHVYTADTGDDKVIALTFDDGPWATTTEEILDILKENGAHATFFQIGNQVAAMADVEKRIASEGHQIATHTWDHASGTGRGVDLTRMSSDEQVQEVEKGFSAIEDTLGTKVSRVMRAPGGNYHGSIITTLKDKVTAEIGWNIDTEDWRRPGADAIASAILKAKSGDVVLMHDGGGDRSQTVEALRQALPQLVSEGYKFVTIDELLAYGMPQD